MHPDTPASFTSGRDQHDARPSEHGVRDVFDLLPGHQLHVGGHGGEQLQGDADLHAAERGAQAVVRPFAKRQVQLRIGPVDPEPVGVGSELGGVAIGGGEAIITLAPAGMEMPPTSVSTLATRRW